MYIFAFITYITLIDFLPVLNSLLQASGLNERFQQILDMSSKRTVIKLNGNKYRDLVRTSPRNYSVVVMFTALSPKRQCTICK